MLREVRIFPALLRIGFANMVAYRAEVVVWILTTTMPLIMYAMWSTIAMEAPVGRFDQATFASYFLVMLVVRQLSSSWVVWELNGMIRSGQLSLLLLRPLHPAYYLAAENLGAVPLRFLVLAPIVAITLWVMPEIQVSDDPSFWILGAATLFFSWLLTFLFQATIGLLALYTQQSLSFQEAWFGTWAVCSGYLFPLELFPGLKAVVVWLPFRSMGALPVEILLGHLTGPALLHAIAGQLTWVALALVLFIGLWPRAMRRFEAYGG